MEQIRLLSCVVIITVAALPIAVSAWNIPGRMLSGVIAYQVLQQENPATIDKVKAVLEKHPWYTNQWQARLQDIPVSDRDMVLFMQAARWADDVRTGDKPYQRALWHYINMPFKPAYNILTALFEPTQFFISSYDEDVTFRQGFGKVYVITGGVVTSFPPWAARLVA